MTRVIVTVNDFREDRQGKTFADVLNDPEQPLAEVLAYFSDEGRQRRMEEAEIHHDRPPLAGVVRELESIPSVHAFLSSKSSHRSKRLRQAIGVVVRMVMERRGWRKTGKKGSLGVRTARKGPATEPQHNTGGLAFWFLRAERYEHPDGLPFVPARARARSLTSPARPQPPVGEDGMSRVGSRFPLT
jgi:hypothetical protein